MRSVMFFGTASVAVARYPSYDEWCATYGKNDASAVRELIYNDNVQRIEELNAEGHATFDVNEHADLTVEERRRARGVVGFGVDPAVGRPGQCNFQDPDVGILPAEEVQRLAHEPIDWVASGAVTPVKDQSHWGTCGYFASIAVLEGINVVQGKNDLVVLSEQEVIDCCTPGSGGCNGWSGQEIDWYSKDGGVFAKTQSSYPYTGSDDIPKPDGTACLSSSGVPTTATSAGRLCLANDPAMINAHLHTLGPAVWMIQAEGLDFYSAGVLSSPQGDGGSWPSYFLPETGGGIDHATTIVGSGIDSGVEYWKVKNSWGVGWGEAGYFRVKKDEANATKTYLNSIGAIFGQYPTAAAVTV